MEGGCACGRIRYAARVDNDEAYLCHCRMCQRATGSVSIAFKTMRKADIEWAREPDWYQSSPIALRPYCRDCGTSLGFAYPDSEKMDLTVASFDDPARFRPTYHFGIESRLAAWDSTEDLKGARSDEYDALVQRWVDAVGKMPD
jgi:hypothetical protein